MVVQVAELAEWALAAIPVAQRAQHAEHAAPHVLALFKAAFSFLACTRASALGSALRMTPELVAMKKFNPESQSRSPLFSDDLSAHVVSITLEHVLPVVLSPEAGFEAPQVCHSYLFYRLHMFCLRNKFCPTGLPMPFELQDWEEIFLNMTITTHELKQSLLHADQGVICV